ncbi:hypothetical protein ACIQI7_15625 [Kitasatospora sp. NPDC092039]|uniref:hypothetical protein n=1 Tax=Kitasatospora sp. NPDC092039 TaxID=3364086 RepID=UPI0037F34808
MAVGTALDVVLTLPLLPVDLLNRTPVNPAAADSVGWPALTAQVAAVYDDLQPADRAVTAVLTDNYGEAGALDRYKPAHRLPPVDSGNNDLHRFGPPPDTVHVIIAVAIDPTRLAADFTDCHTAAHIGSTASIDTANATPRSPCAATPMLPGRNYGPVTAT